MKTSRVSATLKAAARRFTAGLICLCMMLSMADIALPALAYGLEGQKPGTTVMEYIVWAWHSDSRSDAVEKSGCIYIKEEGGYACEGELKPDEDKGATITIEPGNFNISDEEFQGFSIAAGQDAASIDKDGNLVITYNPNVHIVKAHAFFKSTGGQVAGSDKEEDFGGKDGLDNLEQDTALAWGYPENTRDNTTNADLSYAPITDESGRFIMKSADPTGTQAQARVDARLAAKEIWVSGYRDGVAIDWTETHLTDAKVYKTTAGLHTDKTVTVLDEDAREYQIDLESWFAGNNKAAVGLILDASGSMAFSSENDDNGNKTFTKITHNDGKLFEEHFKGEDLDAEGCLDAIKVKMDGVTDATDISRKILTNEEVNTILNSVNPSEEESNTGINPTENTDNSSLGYTGYNYYIFDKRSSTNEYVPIGYWDGTTESLHRTGESTSGGGGTGSGGGSGGESTPEPSTPGGEGSGGEGEGGDTPAPSTGMPGLDNLVGYYDFQKNVLFANNDSPDSNTARTWGINRAPSATEKYAKMVDAVDASEINFSTPGTDVTDSNYGNKDDAIWNKFNWDEDRGLNVSYVGSNGNQLDKALLLDGELNTSEHRNFSISFTLSSAKKYGKEEKKIDDGSNTSERDQILYIGPLENSEKNYLSIYRDSNGSDSRLKIGNVVSGSNKVVFSMKHFETIIGYSKETPKPITYTLTFEYDDSSNTTKVKVYRDGKITHTDSSSDTVDNENTSITLPENSRVILGGLKDKYDGQDLYVDNVYIFDKALQKDEVSKLYNDYQNNEQVKAKASEKQAQPWTITPEVSTVSAPLSRIANTSSTSGTGMPGYSENADENHLVSYYDFQNTVSFNNTNPNDYARTWGINRAPSGTEKYAKMIAAVDAGSSINFNSEGQEVTDDNYTSKDDAVWNKVNWDTDKGFNVSYQAKNKGLLTNALLLDGELNTTDHKNFTVSFTLGSQQKNGKDEAKEKGTNDKIDRILYIGPLNNTAKQYVNVYRDAGRSDSRLKIGTNGDNGKIYNQKDFESIVDKNTPITYTLTFTYDEGTKQTNVKVYKNGSRISDSENPDGVKIDLPENCRVILGGLKDEYDGQDLYVDNVYIFDTALSSAEVKTLYNDYQNDENVKKPGTAQAQPWTITPKTDPTEVPDDALLYFTANEDKSATALLQDQIVSTPAADRAGWYYVTSTSQWKNILEAGTAKTMDALRNDIKYEEETNKPYYFNGVTEDDDEAEGKLNSDIAPDGTPTGGYYYYQPKQFEPLKFFLDEAGHLCCFYGSGNATMDANGWSHVYVKKNTARIKVEVLQHALGRFVTKLSENTPDSTIGAVRFSTQRYGTTAETFESTDHTEELAKFKLLDWTSDAQNAISILNNERSGAGANGVEANDDGQYNYVLTGNTSTAAGFKTYNTYLKNNLTVDENTKKYLIVFTDGKDSDLSSALSKKDAPSIENLLDPTNENALEAVKLASDLRKEGYTILCVMLSGGSVVRDSEDYKQAIHFLAALAGEEYKEDKIPANHDPKSYEGPTREQYQNIFEGNNAEQITEAFSEDIVGRIADSLNDYVVKDYIDPRFDLVDSDDRVWKLGEGGLVTIGNATPENISGTSGYRINLRPNRYDESIEGYSAILHYDTEKEAYYLEWNNVTIPGCSVGVNALSVWNAQITVKAKEDFIGGNTILTNGDGELENYVYPESIRSGDTDNIASSSGTGDAQRAPENVSGDTTITNYPSKGFPRTAVNVNVTGLTIKDDRQVLFMGEELTNEDVAKKLGENVDSAWYWDYLKRYAEYQHAVDSSKYAPTDGSDSFDALIKELVTLSTQTYPYYYLPDVGAAATAAKNNKEPEKLGTLTFKWEDIEGTDGTDGTEYAAYPADDGITSDISPRRSRLTVQYTPDESREIKVEDSEYKLDTNFKPTAGDSQTATGEINGSYTTNIVSGEIAFEMALSADVVKYLQTYAPGQTVTYQAQLVRKDTGSNEVIGTYTAEYKVPAEPEENPTAKTVTATIKYADDTTYEKNGLPMGEYAVQVIGGSGFGLKFGDTVVNVPLTGSEASSFSSFNESTTKTAAEMEKPSPAATTHTVDEFAAETDTDGTIKIGGKTAGKASGSSDYRDQRYAMAQISATIETRALSISKKVERAPATDADKAFEFTITLGGANNNNTYDYDGDPTTVNGVNADPANKKITFTEGEAKVQLKNGQSIAIRGIDVGTSYTVSETSDADYNSEVTAGSETGTISETAASSVAYTNTHKNSYKVIYDLNGGSGDVPADYENAGYLEGETAELWEAKATDVTKADAVFIGWSAEKHEDVINSQADASEIKIITEIGPLHEDATVYAVWAEDVRGGQGDDPDPNRQVDPSDNPSSPDGIADYLEVTLTYDANKGKGDVPRAKMYRKDAVVTLVTAEEASKKLTNADAVLIGWSLKTNDVIKSEDDEKTAEIIKAVTLDADTTVHAVWAIDVKGGPGKNPDPGKDVEPGTNPANPNNVPDYRQATLTYDANGGGGTVPPDTTVNKGEKVTLADGKGMKLENAVFLGWSLEQHSVIKSQAEEDKVTIITEIKSLDADTTVHAVWAEDIKGGPGKNDPDPSKPVGPENPSNPSGIPDYKEVTLTYDPNGGEGTVPSPKAYEKGKRVELNDGAGLKRENAVFLGWSKTKQGIITSQDAEDAAGITKNVILNDDTTVHAVWAIDENGNGTADYKEHQYTVTLELNGGTAGTGFQEETSVNEGESFTFPADPTKSGHTFKGWSNDGGITLYKAGDKVAVTADVTYTAQYEEIAAPKTFTVTLDINGGTPVGDFSEKNTVNEGESFTFPTDPTKAGYTFKGWSTEGDGHLYKAGNTVAVTADVTYVAQYEETKPAPGTGTLTINKVVVNSPTTPETYAFEVSGGSEPQTITGSGSTSLELEPGTYTVTETTTGDFTTTVDGSVGKTTTVTVSAGGNAEVTFTNTYKKTDPPVQTTGTLTINKVVVNSPTTPETYAFEVSGGSEPQTITGSGSTSLELEPGTYTVTETTTGDFTTTVDGNAGKTTTVTVSAGGNVKVTFTNTYDATEPGPGPGTDPSTEVTLTYDVNGGTGSVPSPKAYEKGTKVDFESGNGLKRENAVFLGWSLKKNDIIKTQEEEKGAGIQKTVTLNENTTVYAVWAEDVKGGPGTNPDPNKPVGPGDPSKPGDPGNPANPNNVPDYRQATLTYDANGGTGDVPADKTVNKGTKVTLDGSNGLTRENAVFLGWSLTKPTDVIKTQEEENKAGIIETYTLNEDTTVYAVWAEDEKGGPNDDPEPGDPSNPDGVPDYQEVTLTYDANGGNGDVPRAKMYRKGENVPLDDGSGLTREKAVFIGWSLEQHSDIITASEGEDYAEIIFAIDSIDADTTVYAVWAADDDGTGTPDYDEGTDKVTLTYDKNGGTGNAPRTRAYEMNAHVTLASGSGLTRANTVFLGWSLEQHEAIITSQDEENAVAFITEIASIDKDTTVYAVWAEDVKGGPGTNPDPTKPVTPGDPSNPGVPSNPGDNPGNPNSVPDYRQATLTYDANGGKGNVPRARTYYKGTEVTLVSAEDARDNLSLYGAVLIGWSAEPYEGIITSQAEEDTAGIIGTVTLNEDTTVYAVWAIDVKYGPGTNPDPSKPIDPEENPSNPSGIPDYRETDPEEKHTKFHLDANGGEFDDHTDKKDVADPADLSDLPTPKRDGYEFKGWYENGEPVDPSVLDDGGEHYLVAQWEERSSGSGGGIPPAPPAIDRTEHYGYIIGVTADEVRPEQNITRAEAATILFRLLTDEAREANWSEDSGFADVKSGAWYNHAVAVLHNMGIVRGDGNGNFDPDAMITRAELAAMIERFYEETEGIILSNRFTDVDETKWYAREVLLTDYYGLMQGDGNQFRPEDMLTRAEAMAVFNRLLGRTPHKDHLNEDMIVWTDNMDKRKWYYADVQEATNTHECGMSVIIDDKTYEAWESVRPMRDWAAMEY